MEVELDKQMYRPRPAQSPTEGRAQTTGCARRELCELAFGGLRLTRRLRLPRDVTDQVQTIALFYLTDFRAVLATIARRRSIRSPDALTCALFEAIRAWVQNRPNSLIPPLTAALRAAGKPVL